jgi:Tfp pilus assembly protein PilF
LTYHPDHRAFWGLGLVYQHQRRFEASLAVLKRGIRRHPQSVDLRMSAANSLIRLGRYAEARTYLEAIADRPQVIEQIIRCCRLMADKAGEQAWTQRLNPSGR